VRAVKERAYGYPDGYTTDTGTYYSNKNGVREPKEREKKPRTIGVKRPLSSVLRV
jgi:hypothetical protein